MATKKLQILDGLNFVSFKEQDLTEEQKEQECANIGIEISTDDDALDLRMEYELVDPISDSNGRVFTNSAKEIYIL